MNAEAKIVPTKRPLKSDLDDEPLVPRPEPKPGFLPTGLSRAVVLGSLMLSLSGGTFLFAHRYEVVPTSRGENSFAYRINTLTGSISFCSPAKCIPVADKAPGE